MSLKTLLYRIIFVVFAVKTQEITDESNDIPKMKYYWNIPTFQCDSHKLNFTQLATKFQIIQNENDRFRGAHIDILYDPGDFPAILRDKSQKPVIRNGGVPQEGNLTLHLSIFEQIIEELIPDPNFGGLAIIDFESWRPIFRQNFGVLTPYKDLSMDLEKKKHPFWPNFLIEKEAEVRFEFHARKFMEETLFVGRKLRKRATWGYYAYPYCFNMSPHNMKTGCPYEVTKENDRISWLFSLSDNLYPSLYLDGTRLTAKEKIQMIQGRIEESHRVATMVKNGTKIPQIYPYFWYKYQDRIDGLILWGSSNDVNTKKKCLELFEYIENIFGPLLLQYFKY